MKAYRSKFLIIDRLSKSDPGNAGWQRDPALIFGRVASVEAVARRT